MIMYQRILLLLGLLAGAILGNAQMTTICSRSGYDLRTPANNYCYGYFQIAEDFSAANRSCVRDGANLVFIDNAEENMYLHDRFFQPHGQTEFWIGLNDMNQEGMFRWLNSNSSSAPSYLNWAGGFPEDNTNSRDCAKFASDGWRVHSGGCSTSALPHVCKMRSCSSLDSQNCIGSEPLSESSFPIIAIIVPIVIVIVIILIIVLVLVVVGLWKFNNDAFHRYCCCCLSRGSKSAVHSMQQENQRLRHELSQHKISMSGRYQPGQLGENELSGVPDGRGGVLPTIKRPFSLSPTSQENRILGLPTDALPPLVPQRPSQVNPMGRQTSQTSTSFFFGNPPSRPVRQSMPAGVGMPRPSIPAPVRIRGVATGGRAEEVVQKEEESRSESSESEREG